MIKNKKQMFLVIVSFILVMILGVVSYAFFNYTRTGSTNTVSVGRLNFTSTQNNTINLSNVFPTDSTHLDSSNSGTVTINITGDTNYSEGIEYKVSIVDVDNVVNNKEVGMGFTTTATNLGTQSNDYYNDRGSTTNVYNLVESGSVENDELILVGYIKPDQNGVNGSINVTAYIDNDRVGISDTVSRIENNNLVYGETEASWIQGREIFTTEEWNSLSTDGVSFKVKVEANEGIWVNEPKYYVLKNLANIQNWSDIKGNITSIEFSTNSEVPNNAITSFDATDLSSMGPVTVYTLDDGLGTNTYKAVICADDIIYAPENSYRLFYNMQKLVSFDSDNFKVDNVTNMSMIFLYCRQLSSIDNLLNWNTSNVENMSYAFNNCVALTNVDGLTNWNVSNVTNIEFMFGGCISLQNVNGLIKWNTSSVETMRSLFNACSALTNVNGLANWNTSNVINMEKVFYVCEQLTNPSAISNWNTSNVTTMHCMFAGCSRLGIVDLSSWNMSNVTTNSSMFENTGLTSIIMPTNYTKIDNYMFNHGESYNGTSFTIPRSVTYIGNSHIFYNFGKDNVFTRFIVESGSTSFKTIDDILFTYDGTRLISIPRGKTFTNRIYEIPEGVTFLNELSFSRNKNIDTLVLPNSYVIERYIDENNNSYNFRNSGNSLTLAIYRYTTVKEYELKNDNIRYMSYNGCIYSKDGLELIAVPLHYTGILNIKSGTTTIGQEAFWTDPESLENIDSITTINIPSSVTTIEANQLTTLNALMSRSTNPVTITIDSGNTEYQITNDQIVAR